MSSISKHFEEKGELSRHLPGYEVRPQQIEMAEAVQEAIEGKKHLVAEAGPGVGKSLAYLVPFIKWSVEENKRVAVSTYTKALQNQLAVKDLPFLRKALGIDFEWAICMGSDNYVCLRKAGKVTLGLFTDKKKRKRLDPVIKWLKKTESGLVTDMDFVPDRTTWGRFSREADLCQGRRCPRFHECYYMRARKLQQEANILISNHSLLFSHLMSEANVLPEFSALVLDEAHTLEDIATVHLGRELSEFALFRQLDNIENALVQEEGEDEEAEKGKKDAREKLERTRILFEEFFKKSSELIPERDTSSAFSRDLFPHEEASSALDRLSSSLVSLSDIVDDEDESEILKVYAERLSLRKEALQFIFCGPEDGYVYWAEIKTLKAGENASFHAAPVEIKKQMRACLFDRVEVAVLTSATLSSSGKRKDLSFIKERLGIESPLELVLDSPFDYKENVLLYLPGGIADPNTGTESFKKDLARNIIDIYDCMGGRIFSLFTSYSMLNSVSDIIEQEREDIELLKQGSLPRYVLLDVFKKNNHTILMGTSTFWQGVDVQGSALECVIVTRLPFAVPSDPITSARIRKLREEGMNPFTEYQIPQALIMFKQGFGRLIRSHSDRGVFTVLDPRVATKEYGSEFLSSIPPCSTTHQLEDVKEFFSSSSVLK